MFGLLPIQPALLSSLPLNTEPVFCTREQKRYFKRERERVTVKEGEGGMRNVSRWAFCVTEVTWWKKGETRTRKRGGLKGTGESDRWTYRTGKKGTDGWGRWKDLQMDTASVSRMHLWAYMYDICRATVRIHVDLPSPNPQWHVWSNDLISCMHQYSFWSHMYLPHLVPFVSDSLSTSCLNINQPFHRQTEEC